MRKVSTTVQLPKDLYETLEELKKKTGLSKNKIIELSLRAYVEGRAFNISPDLMKRLKEIQRNFGVDPSFLVDRALRLFFQISDEIGKEIEIERVKEQLEQK